MAFVIDNSQPNFTYGEKMAIESRFIVIVCSLAVLLPLAVGRPHHSGNIHNCIEDLRQHIKKGYSEELAEFMCERQVEWLHRAAIGETRGFQPPPNKISQAQINFMKSLSTNADSLSKLNKIDDLTDWPYIGPSAKARKEYRMLTDEERHRFHNAINVLKTFYIDDKNNVYDTFVDFHFPEYAPAAHIGANFIGWHREFLHRFEKALQLVDPDITLPYWDTRMDSVLGDEAADSMLWTEDFMGNKAGDVVTGPFKNWVLKEPTQGRYVLWRGEVGRPFFFDDDEYSYSVAIDNFHNLTYFSDRYFEFYHGNNHAWVGGVMKDAVNSPGDPMFWLHHTFIDKVWHDQQSRVFRELGRQHYFYPRDDDTEAYGVGFPKDPFDPNSTLVMEPSDSHHYYDNPMWPFDDKKVHEGLSDVYWLYSYYEEPPTCNTENPDCGSPYLFCMPENSRCVPKLQPEANCANFRDYDSCYDGQCIDDRCVSENKAQKPLFHPKK